MYYQAFETAARPGFAARSVPRIRIRDPPVSRPAIAHGVGGVLEARVVDREQDGRGRGRQRESGGEGEQRDWKASVHPGGEGQTISGPRATGFGLA